MSQEEATATPESEWPDSEAHETRKMKVTALVDALAQECDCLVFSAAIGRETMSSCKGSVRDVYGLLGTAGHQFWRGLDPESQGMVTRREERTL